MALFIEAIFAKDKKSITFRQEQFWVKSFVGGLVFPFLHWSPVWLLEVLSSGSISPLLDILVKVSTLMPGNHPIPGLWNFLEVLLHPNPILLHISIHSLALWASPLFLPRNRGRTEGAEEDCNPIRRTSVSTNSDPSSSQSSKPRSIHRLVQGPREHM